MEGGGFNGHTKLPRLSSFSEMNHQELASDQLTNGQPAPGTNISYGAGSEEYIGREQDLLVPIANVTRLMRKVLPPHAKISDDAKETIQECVSEYIGFITSEANERCQREQRKTVTAEDILWAMAKLGLDDYVDPLTLYLHRYRELEGDRPPLKTDSLPKRNHDFTPRVGVTVPPGFQLVPHHPRPSVGYYGPPPASNGGGDAPHPRPPVGYYGPPPPPPASNGGGDAPHPRPPVGYYRPPPPPPASNGGGNAPPGFGPYWQQKRG